MRKSSGFRRSFGIGAAALGLVAILISASPAAAIPPPTHVPGQGEPKLLGQLKNGFNHLCMDDGFKSYAGHPVTFARCRTVNHGYTTKSQYFFLDDAPFGQRLHTLRGNICIGRRVSGNPVPGDNLVTKKCDTTDASQLFNVIGGEDGVPFYFYAKNTKFRGTKYTVGVRTRSVGAHVGISNNGRNSVSAWHGKLKEVR